MAKYQLFDRDLDGRSDHARRTGSPWARATSTRCRRPARRRTLLNVSASLGMSVKALTRFVKGSPIAAYIKGELRRRNHRL